VTPARHPSRATSARWQDVLANAEQQLIAAQNALALTDLGSNAKPVAAAAVIAAIGFGDALSVQCGGTINTQQHDRLPGLLRQLLGRDADAAQMARLGRILSRKNMAQYGGTYWTCDEARDYLEQANRFATWARTVLSTRSGTSEP
jgi:hypothetical protein